jgi:hypothetical protein
MEASEQSPESQEQQPPATGQPVPPEGDDVAQAAGPPPQQTPQSQQEGQVEVPEEGEGPVETERQQLSDEERNPAREQAPVATDAQEAITGDPGFGEQTAKTSEGGAQSVDTPFGNSMPPPQSQSGMPLAEDRAAVERGEQPGPGGQPQGEESGESAS